MSKRAKKLATTEEDGIVSMTAEYLERLVRVVNEVSSDPELARMCWKEGECARAVDIARERLILRAKEKERKR